MSIDQEAGDRITANTERLLRDMCRTFGLPPPEPLGWRDNATLARIQAETAAYALEIGNYSAALDCFEDTARYLRIAVRQIGEAAE